MKILLSLLAMFFFGGSQAQNLNYVDVALSVTDFAGLTPGSSAIWISDTARGGMFFLYNGPDPADNGMVFTDAKKRKWKRAQTNNEVQIKWYGAIAQTNGTNNDARAAILAARDYCYAHKGSKLIVSSANSYYYSSNTISFADHDIRIEGENSGTSHSTNSVIRFPANVVGFDFNVTVNAAHFVTIKNLTLWGGYAAGNSDAFDKTAHGLRVNTNINCENVFITGFKGNGFHITGGSPTGTPIFGIGSTNRSYFKNCEGDYCENGWYINGGDANTITFDNCSGTQNRRWGFYDYSFLGNTYINCHTATNALQEVTPNNSGVSYKGVRYIATTTDDFNNTNFRPDRNPDKWDIYENGAVTAWDSTRRYYSAGPYTSVGNAAQSVYINNYSEEFQPKSRYGGRALILGGLDGPGSVGGAYLQSNNSSLIMRSPVSFERKLIFGNLYNGTSEMTFDNARKEAERNLSVRVSGQTSNPNIKWYGDGRAEIINGGIPENPLMWLHNPGGQGVSRTLTVSLGTIKPTDRILDVRSSNSTYDGGLGRFTVFANGKINLGTYNATNEYADNAAALASGKLKVGDVYRTGDILKIVH